MLPSPPRPLTETYLCYSLGLNLQVAKLRMFSSGSKAFVPLEQWFSPGGDFVLGGHLAKSGEFMVVLTLCVCVCVCVCVRIHTHVWVLLASSILWVEARDAAKLPAVPEAAPYRRELCRLQCQQCRGGETLLYNVVN